MINRTVFAPVSSQCCSLLKFLWNQIEDSEVFKKALNTKLFILILKLIPAAINKNVGSLGDYMDF